MWIRKLSLSFLILFMSLSLLAQEVRDINLANAYYKSGEIDKAKTLYEKLLTDPRNYAFMYNNYIELLVAEGEIKEADKFYKKLVSTFPENINFQVDYISFLHDLDRKTQALKQFDLLTNYVITNRSLVRSAAQQFMSKQQSTYAQELYWRARQATRNNQAYALELASLYRFINDKEKMVEEYLIFLEASPANARYVKNMLQNTLKEDEDLQKLENILLAHIQKDANNLTYPDLLIWTYVQQKNFYGAFIQARAIDKRKDTAGSTSLEIGEIALENNDYHNAIRIFEYITKTYPQTISYIKAKTALVYAKSQVYTNTYPVDTLGIRSLTNDYTKLIQEIGLNTATLEAQREKAILHAFYLDEKNTAIQLLKEVIEHPASTKNVKAQAKLDLGDIYILTNEHWESALLYAQVDKDNKNELLGYQAKLKNAKLSYYKGDFDLAISRLDILKLATDREISNDAIQLNTMIKKNIAYDTSRQALKDFAAIELLLYHNKKAEAMHQLDILQLKYGIRELSKEEKFLLGKKTDKSYYETSATHQIADDIIWLQAKINHENGFFEEALMHYEKIYEDYPSSIYADDAFYMSAKIFEEGLKEHDTAMQYYQSFLKKYPGSFFAADARMRFRRLRGDIQ